MQLTSGERLLSAVTYLVAIGIGGGEVQVVELGAVRVLTGREMLVRQSSMNIYP